MGSSFNRVFVNSINCFLCRGEVVLMSEYTIGIDPSFRRTGVCIYDHQRHECRFLRVEAYPAGVPKSFIGTYKAAHETSSQIMRSIQNYKNFDVVLEFPPPTSAYSAGMYTLVSTILYDLLSMDVEVKLAHPGIGRYLWKQKWKKSDSVRVAQPYFVQKGRLSGDEADAFVMLLPQVPRLFQESGALNQVRLRTMEDS